MRVLDKIKRIFPNAQMMNCRMPLAGWDGYLFIATFLPNKPNADYPVVIDSGTGVPG